VLLRALARYWPHPPAKQVASAPPMLEGE
jgi:hypothetical protein